MSSGVPGPILGNLFLIVEGWKIFGSGAFLKGLKQMKDSVFALWIAIGAKSVMGRFPVTALEEIGFTCPEMKYPLRNPLQIARYCPNRGF